MNPNHPIRKTIQTYKNAFYDWLVFSGLTFPGKHEKNTVVFYPSLPGPRHVLGRVFRILRYKITNDLHQEKNAKFVVNWEDTTFRTRFPELAALATDREVINIRNRDISKKYVDAVFAKIFGYGTAIDPTTYRGKCVKKGDINAVHDGTIINCPISAPENGYIYQKLIHNQVNDAFVEDIRVPVFRDEIPFVYIKNRPIEKRFGSKNTKTVITNTRQVFTETEIKNIIAFTTRIGMNCGEMDVLRDRKDGKMYIIDVNNTPGGPPNGLSRPEEVRALRLLTSAFITNFITKKPKTTKTPVSEMLA